MLELKKLREQKGTLQNEMKAIADKVQADQRSMTAEEKEVFDRHYSEAENLGQQIETLERVDKVKAFTPNAIVERPRTYSRDNDEQAFRCWLLSATGNHEYITDTMRAAADHQGVSLQSKSWTFKRAQSVGTTTEGGHLTSGSQYLGLDRMLKAYGGVRQFANVFRTAHGNPIHFATLDDTANEGVIHAELTADVANVSAVFGKKSLGSFTVTSGVMPVSLELIRDAETSIIELVSSALAERIARQQAEYGCVGAGTTVPFGVTVEATTGSTAASTTAITFAELRTLYFSVDAAYRDSAKCAWLMNDTTYASLHGILDDVDRPLLWNASGSAADGFGRTLFGKPIILDNKMPSPAAGTKPIVFGDGSKFLWRDVGDTTIKVITEDVTYALALAVAVIGFASMDSKLVNTSAVKRLAMAAS